MNIDDLTLTDLTIVKTQKFKIYCDSEYVNDFV
jgi:hypothetical protein